MTAVIASTDTPEAIKAAFAGKSVKVTVVDSLGTDVTAQGTGVVSSDENSDTAEQGSDAGSDGDTETAASSNTEDTTSSESAAEGNTTDTKPDAQALRIDGLIKQVGELTGKLDAVTAAKPAPKDDKEVKVTVSDTEPKPEDFDTSADYLKALSKWAIKEARKEDKAAKDADDVKSKATKAVDVWNDQLKTARAKYKDFDKVMGDTEIGKAAGQALFNTPDGVELAYYIGKNPAEAKTLVSLTNEREVLMALGEVRAKVKATVKAAPAADGKKKPEPITPVGGSTNNSVDKQNKDMNYKEYKAKRNAEDAAKRKAQGGR